MDSCAGNGKHRPELPRFHQLNTPFLDRLAEAGVAPDQVDFVLCTHLHADHCGWNTRLPDGRWVATFPHAKYVFSRAEHQPVQVVRPAWNSRFCPDADAARVSRRWVLDHAAERRVTLFTAHFANSSAGRVTRHDDHFDWSFV